MCVPVCVGACDSKHKLKEKCECFGHHMETDCLYSDGEATYDMNRHKSHHSEDVSYCSSERNETFVFF